MTCSCLSTSVAVAARVTSKVSNLLLLHPFYSTGLVWLSAMSSEVGLTCADVLGAGAESIFAAANLDVGNCTDRAVNLPVPHLG